MHAWVYRKNYWIKSQLIIEVTNRKGYFFCQIMKTPHQHLKSKFKTVDIPKNIKLISKCIQRQVKNIKNCFLMDSTILHYSIFISFLNLEVNYLM